MLKGRRILSVVPARGGSKGIKLKNLCKVGGVPLVALVGQVTSQLDYLDCTIISTDNEEIARIAEAAGLAAPFRRPLELSGDIVGDWEVLHHALHEMERLKRTTYDVIVMLQPTSPSRTPEQVTATIEHLIDGKFDSVWTVSETVSLRPAWSMRIWCPEAFWKPQPPKLDRQGLIAALGAGRDVPGAILGNAPMTISVRTK